MWLDVQVSEPLKIEDEMKRRFREYWTVEHDNYPVPEDYLGKSHSIPVRAEV